VTYRAQVIQCLKRPYATEEVYTVKHYWTNK